VAAWQRKIERIQKRRDTKKMFKKKQEQRESLFYKLTNCLNHAEEESQDEDMEQIKKIQE